MCYLNAIKNSDELALNQAFKLYYPPLYAYIFDKTKSVELTKDVVQLTFIKLWKYRLGLKEDIELSHQIFRIARTTMIDELRHAQTIRKAESACERPALSEDINESIFYNDTRRKLEELITRMPPMRQQVFRLSRLSQYNYKEISELLSISTKTVENHISLALKFIKPFFPIPVFLIIFLK